MAWSAASLDSGRTQANLDIAIERGMLDAAARDPIRSRAQRRPPDARGADRRDARDAREDDPAFAPDAVVTDAGSVKGWVVHELEPLIKSPMTLVAAHPVAGKETTGAAAGDAELFLRPARHNHTVRIEHRSCYRQN